MSPRTKLVSVGYAFHALRADTAGVSASVFVNSIGSAEVIDNSLTASDLGAGSVGTSEVAKNSLTADDLASNSVTADEIAAGAVGTSEVADNSLTAADLASNSVGSAEVIDNSLTSNDLAANSVSSSEIVDNSVAAIDIATGGVTSTEIADGTVINADLNSSAAIDVTKISGTAVNLSSTQTITGQKQFGDSTMIVDNTGISIGDDAAPTSFQLIRVERNYNTTGTKYGYWSTLDNQDAGFILGVRSDVTNNGAGNRYAFYGTAGDTLNTSGISYGVFAVARGGAGSLVFGVYAGTLGNSTTDYAGYFLGNVHVTGTLSKGAGSFIIDHPLDPANKYLVHSFVESPDMMNVYNGNVTLPMETVLPM
ncbi:MAG: hypothetical protein IH931_06745 [candidate division Zixibacteria bacterium]|nr:hypothetical protein [candidate division Zixibacteria bacterium]